MKIFHFKTHFFTRKLSTKIFLIVLSLIGSNYYAEAQNCGVLDSVTYNIVDNGNGTSDYSFLGYFSTTSGGAKSVVITIFCGTDTFVKDDCVPTTTFQTTKAYGPYLNVTNCTSTIYINWNGKTNNVCGGSNCGGANGISPVPVQLLGLEATRINNSVQLKWATAMELNNDKFIIQRDLQDGNGFKDIAEISGQGNSNNLTNYSYIDQLHSNVNRTIFYRLKQVDYDQTSSYSKVVKATMEREPVLVYPNPANDLLKVHINNDDLNTSVRLMDISGLEVFNIENIESDVVTIDTKEFSEGMYFLTVANNNQFTNKRIIVKH